MKKYKRFVRYHVRLGKKRSTVQLDDFISTLLALKLKVVPDTEQAHTAVRKYLQGKLDKDPDPRMAYVSRWLRKQSVLDLVDTKLSKAYWDWIEKEG